MCKGLKRMFTFFLFMCCSLYTAPFLNNMLYADPISGSSISGSVEKLWPGLNILDLLGNSYDLGGIPIQNDLSDPIKNEILLNWELYNSLDLFAMRPPGRGAPAIDINYALYQYEFKRGGIDIRDGTGSGSPLPIPEPATLFLFGTGLLIFSRITSRKNYF